ncbi:MAG: glyoxalase [Pedobacter sp.]|nr:MAG: glyoxalase [Pedobacter sp.]
MCTIKYTWHVLAVRNLEESVRYYVEQLGFDEIRRTPNGKAFLKHPHFQVILGECPDEMLAKHTGDHAYFAYIVCEEIDVLYRDLLKRKAIISSPIDTKPWGMREFNVDTPDGHRMVFGQEC